VEGLPGIRTALLIADQMAAKNSWGTHQLRGMVPIRFQSDKP